MAQSIRREGKSIGLVPTMGFLHEGHLSLVDLLADRCDFIVLTIFVNPTQFGIGEDLDDYPRNLEGDLELCGQRRVDLVFAPTESEMYPAGYSTFVEEEEAGKGLCGVSRPTHFRGVTTVCAKLFNVCRPDFLALGRKDAQQVVVLERMIRDLNFPIEVLVGPIIREADGLAMSSRNSYLEPRQREHAALLYQSLLAGKRIVEEKEVRNVERVKAEVMGVLNESALIRVNYVEIVDRETMKPERDVELGRSAILVAGWLDEVRLIDNIRL